MRVLDPKNCSVSSYGLAMLATYLADGVRWWWRLAGKGRRWFRTRRYVFWPTVEGEVLSGRIEETAGSYVVRAPYSFFAAGERYGGCYERSFTFLSDAQATLQRLHESPSLVRYKPGHPDTSALDGG